MDSHCENPIPETKAERLGGSVLQFQISWFLSSLILFLQEEQVESYY